MLTIGHSNRPLHEFLDLLEAHAAGLTIDVRTVPRSRHNPQFNRETLPEALAGSGPRKDSTNTGWRNANFRGYADYMQTGEFARTWRA